MLVHVIYIFLSLHVFLYLTSLYDIFIWTIKMWVSQCERKGLVICLNYLYFKIYWQGSSLLASISEGILNMYITFIIHIDTLPLIQHMKQNPHKE